MGGNAINRGTRMGQGKSRILTLLDLYNAVDWTQYPLDQGDGRESRSLREQYLWEAIYSEYDEARREAIVKLGPVYMEAMELLKREGLGEIWLTKDKK